MSLQTRLRVRADDRADQRVASKSAALKRRRLADLIGRIVVTTGGIGIIICILAILVFIALEVMPLWKSVKSELVGTYVLRESPDLSSYFLDYSPSTSEFPFLATGGDEYGVVGFVITRDGHVHFLSLKDGKTIKDIPLSKIEGQRVLSVFVSDNNRIYALGTQDGYILPIKVNFKVTLAGDGKRIIDPGVSEEEPIHISPLPLMKVAFQQENDESLGAAAVTLDNKLLLFSQEETTSLLGGGEKQQHLHDLTANLAGSRVTAIELDNVLDNLYVGTEEGKLFHWNISNKDSPELVEIVDATGSSSTAITALGFLIGGRSLIVGDEAGDVSVWFQVEDPTSPKGKRLKKIHVLDSLEAPITAISPSPRNRGFLTGDKEGNVVLYYATSEQKLLQLNTEREKINALSFSPKSNGLLAIDQKGKLYNWHIDNPHPGTTLKTLFGKVWYEGYSKPEYVWQSTGGSDAFEPKFSLTPLAFGTLKGAFYALFFAIPLSILGAICVSQFMHPSLRNTIKPVIEIMAALPSVVLGFFAGLWLAPHIEKIVPAVFLMPLVMTALTIISVALWQYVPKSIKGRFVDGTELFLLIPVIILGVLISLWLNTPIEGLLLNGDYKGWLYNVLGLQYDQRNALIVGFAMGFAVIPIIFTISEDALSSVPKNLTAGSFALGANRWQTAIRVILPTASAGIFSAVMIGLGRAVGETMIVLMATGNTPLMDWSIFNGFRALSANIAVEIPEAPVAGTLYRVLFLAALLLFLVTFIVNTAAELVRQRLRRKFGQL
jgi:phosphate transport system permease protein